MHRALTIVALAAGAFGASCASSETSNVIEVPAGAYPAVFNATRDALREMRFTLDRVDAASGVIATLPKPSSGFATPWDGDQTSIGQEWDDFANRHERTARVTFRPSSSGGSFDGPLTGEVTITIDRLYRPGWSPETRAVRLTTQTQDPALEARGMWPSYSVVTERDPGLEAKLAGDIRRRLSTGASAGSVPPPTGSDSGAASGR